MATTLFATLIIADFSQSRFSYLLTRNYVTKSYQHSLLFALVSVQRCENLTTACSSQGEQCICLLKRCILPKRFARCSLLLFIRSVSADTLSYEIMAISPVHIIFYRATHNCSSHTATEAVTLLIFAYLPEGLAPIETLDSQSRHHLLLYLSALT